LIACRSKSTNINLNTYEDDSSKSNVQNIVHLYEWRFNIKPGETQEKPLYPDMNCGVEFPVINLKLLGRRIQFIYAVRFSHIKKLGIDGLIKFDLVTNKYIIFEYPPNCSAGEAVFVPKQDAESEDDGYLITYVTNMTDENNITSQCWVMDAKNFGSEPLARISLPQRVPNGFHGKWISKYQLEHQN